MAAAAASAAATTSGVDLGPSRLPTGRFESQMGRQSIGELVHAGRASTHVIAREEQQIRLTNAASPSAPGDTPEFLFNYGWDIDVDTMVLRLDNATCTLGTTPCFPNGMWNIIESITIVANGSRLLYFPNFNIVSNIEYFSGAERNAQGAELYGLDTLAARRAQAGTAQTYYVPLSHLFKGWSVFPRFTLLKRQEVHLQIQFATAASCLENAGGAASTFSCVPVLVYDGVKISASASAALQAAAAQRGGLVFHTASWAPAAQTITAASLSDDIGVNIRKSSIYKMMSVQRTLATINTQTTLDRLQDWIVNGNTNFQLDVAGTLVPPRAIQTTATTIREAYLSFLKATNGQISSMPPLWISDISFADYAGTSPSGVGKAILTIDLRKDADGGILSGIDTTNPGSYVTLQMRSTAGATATTQCFVFVFYDAKFAIYADGSVVIIE